MKRAALLGSLLILGACSGGTSSSGTPPGEDKALDDAAASLDANTMDTNAAVIVDEDERGDESEPQ